MGVIIGVAICIFFLLDFMSIVTEVFGRRTAAGNGLKEPAIVYRRRIFLHVGM